MAELTNSQIALQAAVTMYAAQVPQGKPIRREAVLGLATMFEEWLAGRR